MHKPACSALLFIMAVLLLQTHAFAKDGAHGVATGPANQISINSPGEAVQAPRIAKRYTEPGMTLNPVAVDIDPHGNIYVSEGWRQNEGAVSVVHGPVWGAEGLKWDLTNQTVEDRGRHIDFMIEKGAYPSDFFTRNADRVRLVKDTNDDGTADQSTIFADGFNDKLDGVAAGVLWHGNKLYFTCIPNLWLLQDKDGDGDADKDTPDERVSLSYGYGVRWSYGGHDLHGLTKGPDGRIYFTIGDRGYNVTTKEGIQLKSTNQGAVFRMWPDGSGLEVFATGLRNPQEIAFDNYGNLFTGDNNCDAGDLARFCYVPEGADIGWRQEVQTLDHRGPWLREHIWQPRFEKNDPAQPAWIMPPIANIGRGPSGLAHYPGTGDAFPVNGSFLMCDYPAGVRHVLVKPDGASFKVVEDSHLNTLSQNITDVDWGYDGRLYLSDWGGGWGPNDRGHLQVMVNEAAHKDQAEVIAEVQQLYVEGFDKLSDKKLLELLGHADQRVRLDAQYELADARRHFEEQLWGILTDHNKPELMRLHALWTAGMKARSGEAINELIDIVIPYALGDPSEHIRAQAIKLLGELGRADLLTCMELLADPSKAVQAEAAIALGKNGRNSAIPELMATLYDNDNNDDVLRHAASYGLSLIGDARAIADESKRQGDAARLGGVLALRRLKSPLLAIFIEDKDLQIAAEAVRAIYDQQIDEHLPTIAKLADALTPDRMIEPIMRRVIEANVRLADADSAERLAKIAANADAPEIWRALALHELTNWSAPRDREDVWGWWMPRPAQTMAHASAAMKTHLSAIKATATGDVLTQARVFELTHILKAGPDELKQLAHNTSEPDAVRMAGVQMLREQAGQQAVKLAEELLTLPDSSPDFRMALRRLILPVDRQAGVQAYLQAFEQGTIPEQQEAIHELAVVRSGGAIDFMVELGLKLERDQLAPELRLDAYHVLTKYRNHKPAARLSAQQYAQQNMLPDDAPFIREASLVGGSAERGRDIFLNNTTAQCQRCHAADGHDSVGPGLFGIATIHDANYFFEALIHPNATIAQGFADTTVRLKNGQSISGRVLADQSTPTALVLTNTDMIVTRIPRDQIDGKPIASELSQMPAMTDKLTPMELRDVIAYLGSLDQTPSPTYRMANASSSQQQAPRVTRIAAGMHHAIWLPSILFGIAGVLLALLLLTIFASRLSKT